MAVHTAVIRLVSVDATGNIVNKSNSTIASVMANINSVHRIYEYKSGSAPNAASDGDSTAPDIHNYLNDEDGDGFRLIHLDQYYVITTDSQ